MNPVRAGLVRRVEEWRWSSARWSLCKQTVGVPITCPNEGDKVPKCKRGTNASSRPRLRATWATQRLISLRLVLLGANMQRATA
jgi:hypothetical protein